MSITSDDQSAHICNKGSFDLGKHNPVLHRDMINICIEWILKYLKNIFVFRMNLLVFSGKSKKYSIDQVLKKLFKILKVLKRLTGEKENLLN